MDLEDAKGPGVGETGMRALRLALTSSLASLCPPSPLCLSFSPSFPFLLLIMVKHMKCKTCHCNWC